MKTKTIIYFLAAVCFSILFYKQWVGINYLIFGIILTGTSLALNRSVVRSWNWIIVAGGIIFSTFFCMYYGNALTITMSILSVLMLQTVSHWSKSSVPLSLVTGYLSVLASPILIISGKLRSDKIKSQRQTKEKPITRIILPIIAVITVSIIFLSLYRKINPVFNEYVIKTLNAISWGWILFTLTSLIIMYSFFFPSALFKKLMFAERKAPNTIAETPDLVLNKFWGKVINFDTERLSAVLMFVVLNILLLLLLIADIKPLFINSALPDGVTYKEYIHSGVAAVICSIVLAISLILFYFRGKLNFDKKSNSVKALTYIWVVQNLVLVAFTFLKNKMYTDAYALTYKRIGVYFYLSFAIIGLFLTAYKLYANKSAWFLVKSNAMVIYISLIFSCAFNWNMIVTNSNINHGIIENSHYIKYLGFANYPTLWEVGAFNNDVWFETEVFMVDTTQTYMLPSMVNTFMEKYEKGGLQSYGVVKQKTFDYFVNLAKEGKLTIAKNETDAE